MNAKEFEKQLEDLKACEDAIAWAKGKTLKIAWKKCERADWMLWYLAKTNYDRKIIVGLACDCAETALQYIKPGEDRPRIAIATARKWIEGKATIEEVRTAATAAAAAAADAAVANDDYAAYAAYAANDAAAAAANAAAANAAYAAAYAAANAAAANAAYATKLKAHKTMCVMIRAKVKL